LNNTIIVFTSDNGAQSGGPSVLPGNAPFAGHKATYNQGGIRVPLLFYWPDKIKNPIKSDLLVSNIDILPTVI
jgi:arylsulfatase A-like enzyme